MTCEAILDRSNKTAKYGAATFLKNQGIPCMIDDRHAILHSKIIIIDDATVKRLQDAIRQINKLIEGEKLVTLSSTKYFAQAIENTEQLNMTALPGLKQQRAFVRWIS